MKHDMYVIEQIRRLRSTKNGNPRFAMWLKDRDGRVARVMTEPDTQCAFLFSDVTSAGKTMYFEFNESGRIDFARELTADEPKDV